MMKLFISLTKICCVAILGLVFTTSCTESDADDTKANESEVEETSPEKADEDSVDPIIGKWGVEDVKIRGRYIYAIFNADGTFVYSATDNPVLIRPAPWRREGPNEIVLESIGRKGKVLESRFKAEIEGNFLTLTSINPQGDAMSHKLQRGFEVPDQKPVKRALPRQIPRKPNAPSSSDNIITK